MDIYIYIYIQYTHIHIWPSSCWSKRRSCLSTRSLVVRVPPSEGYLYFNRFQWISINVHRLSRNVNKLKKDLKTFQYYYAALRPSRRPGRTRPRHPLTGCLEPLDCAHVGIYVCTYLYIYIYIPIYVHTYIYIYIYMCMYVYIYIYVYAYMYVYLYVYMYIYIYIHTHIYIYIYVHHRIGKEGFLQGLPRAP